MIEKTLPKELTLVIDFIKNQPEFVEVENIEDQVDWGSILKLANHHRVYPNVYNTISINKLNHQLPTDFIKSIMNVNHQNIHKMFKLSAELAKVSKEFSQSNIPLICLKGPVIALELYGELSLRPARDLDLLVSPLKLKEAERLLIKNGYHPVDDYDTFEELTRKRGHHKNFINERTGVLIELHWRLHPNVYHEPSFAQLWERREQVTIAGTDVNRLGDTDLFLFLATHGSRHAWFRLRWLYDIHLFLQKPLNYEEIAQFARIQKVEYMIGQTVLLSHQLFNSPIPSQFETFTRSKKSTELTKMALRIICNNININGSPLPLKEYFWQRQYFLSLRKGLKKLEFILQHFYPSQNDVDILKLPKNLYSLYYPLRPFLWIVRRLKKIS